MINIFRKIRLLLLSENKPAPPPGRFSKLLIYTIAEIVLVVIGILIALQINNWNEIRKDSASELIALKDLKQEFSKNTKVFIDHHQFKKTTSDNWKKFISYISNSNLAESNLLTTPVRPGVRTYNPSKSVLTSILSTGKIDKVKNDSLKYFLTSWNDLISDYAEDETRHLEFWDKENTLLERSLLPYRYYNIDSIDSLKNDFYTEIETRKMILDAYSNLEYQNLLLRNLYFFARKCKKR